MSGDFEPEQKRYLEGFVAGLQIAKAAGGIARNGAAHWFDDKKTTEKSEDAPVDLACMSKNRIDRRTGIWTARKSTVAGPQTDVSECSVVSGGRQTSQASTAKRDLACGVDFMQLKPGTSGASMDDFAATPLAVGTSVEIIGDELRGSTPVRLANGEVGSVNTKAFDPAACKH